MTSGPLTGVTATGTRPRSQLSHVVLGSNPNAESRWSQRTGRQADIYHVDFYEDGAWSISCNVHRVGPGTIGWIARQGEGGNPPLCGFIVCTAEPKPSEEVDDNGEVVVEYYVEGRVHGGLWIPGDDIASSGWPERRAPWGPSASRQFRNGEALGEDELQALLDAVPDSTLRTVALEYRDVTGVAPTWA